VAKRGWQEGDRTDTTRSRRRPSTLAKTSPAPFSPSTTNVGHVDYLAQYKALEFCRHTTVHAAGVINQVELKRLAKEAQRSVKKATNTSWVSGTEIILPDRLRPRDSCRTWRTWDTLPTAARRIIATWRSGMPPGQRLAGVTVCFACNFRHRPAELVVESSHRRIAKCRQQRARPDGQRQWLT
jgi:hypothetical protein